jgi:hypothetical protein
MENRAVPANNLHDDTCQRIITASIYNTMLGMGAGLVYVQLTTPDLASHEDSVSEQLIGSFIGGGVALTLSLLYFTPYPQRVQQGACTLMNSTLSLFRRAQPRQEENSAFLEAGEGKNIQHSIEAGVGVPNPHP